MPTPTEQKIFDFLDHLEAIGDPIPTIRVIREVTRVSPNAIGPAIKEWKARKEEAKAKEITERSSQILGETVAKQLDDAFEAIRSLVVQATKDTLVTFEEQDKKRAEAALQREAELHTRALDAEMKSDQLLIEKGTLAAQLAQETELRKKKEQEVDELRVLRDRLESEVEALKKELQQTLDTKQKLEEEVTALRKAAENTETIPNGHLF